MGGTTDGGAMLTGGTVTAPPAPSGNWPIADAPAPPGVGIVLTFGALGGFIVLVGCVGCCGVGCVGAVVGCWSVGVWSGSSCTPVGVIFRGTVGSLVYGSVGESAIVSLP